MESELTTDELGTKEWKLPSGYLHREAGPAVEYTSGNKRWYINNNLHREDGPAVEYTGGSKYWYLNGREYTEKEYKYKIRSIKLKLLLHQRRSNTL